MYLFLSDKLDVSEEKQNVLENLKKLKELEQNDLLSQNKYLVEISSMTGKYYNLPAKF